MRFQSPFLILVLAATIDATQTVYLIRHGEKPDDDGNGLSAAGVARSQCLRTVFGKTSTYNISYVMAQTPKSSGSFLFPYLFIINTRLLDGKRTRPLQTVQPVAQDLGLVVDTSCDRDDPDCVKKVVSTNPDKNILICWEHDALTDIVKELGDKNAPKYPGDSFDIIWTDPSPFTKAIAFTSENCPGIDE
ncbi:hypothetical protein PVAG01_01589 [Phlyctema vagabunda]|uniref:Phosphoglycerate mutase family protein n=1 Tax=Phlyctema vagabunda TaxID=108571 RepID=A0ABR4PXK0_9HELO